MDVYSLVLVGVMTLSCALLIAFVGYHKLNKISMSLKISKLSKFNPIGVYNYHPALMINNKQIKARLQAMKQHLTDKKNGVTESQLTKVSRMMAAKSDSNAAIIDDSLGDDHDEVQVFSLDSRQNKVASFQKETDAAVAKATVLNMSNQPAMMTPMEEHPDTIKPFAVVVSQFDDVQRSNI